MDSSTQQQTAGSDSVRIVLYNIIDPVQFLILSEVDDPDNLKLPGGKFELNESPAEAAVRELLEEVGLRLNVEELDQPVELLNNDGVSKRYIFSRVISPSDLKLTNEIASSAWVTADDVPEGKNKSHILAAVEAMAQEDSNK